MGGFDLSISGFIVASALVVSVLKEKWNVPFVVAILIAVVAAALLGGLAGQICHRFQIQPLIVTLAMGTIALGSIQVQTQGSFSGTAPDWLIRARLAGDEDVRRHQHPADGRHLGGGRRPDGAVPAPHDRRPAGDGDGRESRAPPSTP